MVYLTSWTVTLPILAIGMAGVFLVIGAILLAVLSLNRLTGGRGR